MKQEEALQPATQVPFPNEPALAVNLAAYRKPTRREIELNGKVESYKARLAKLRTLITAQVGNAVVKGHADPRSFDLMVLRNTVRVMKGKKMWRAKEMKC